MILGIAIPSLIALLGGLLAYGYIADVKNRQGFVIIADDMKEYVLEIRRNEKNLLLHKDVEYFKYCVDSISALKNYLSNISPQSTAEIGEGIFSELRNSIQTYSDTINKLYLQLQIETDVVEKVREEGRKLEAYIAAKKNNSELSTNFILNVRRLEKNYMLFRDKGSFTAYENAILTMKNIVPICYECIPYTKVAYSLSNAYNNSESLINDLQATGVNLEKMSYGIAEKERSRINAFLNRTHTLLVTALILICTIGPLLVYKTASYIVAPIKRLSEITRKIAEGDLTQRAPLKEHDETYSLAMSFNTMLDQLQLTHNSLEQSIELLHEKQIEAEKRASLGFLISGVTHELNNPLNNISLTAESMREDINELTQEDLKEYIHDILSQSERAKHIVADLLEFVGTHKTAVMEKLDIINLVEEAASLVANQLRVSNINLKMDIPNAPFFVQGNKSKLEEIFVNIMINAVHAMKNTGLLTISARPDKEYKNIIIDISDTGCGIPEKDMKNIFEPFFTTKPPGEGTGLGLSVAHSLVMKHKGDISVHSKLGEGTTFTIKLPIYEDGLI